MGGYGAHLDECNTITFFFNFNFYILFTHMQANSRTVVSRSQLVTRLQRGYVHKLCKLICFGLGKECVRIMNM